MKTKGQIPPTQTTALSGIPPWSRVFSRDPAEVSPSPISYDSTNLEAFLFSPPSPPSLHPPRRTGIACNGVKPDGVYGLPTASGFSLFPL